MSEGVVRHSTTLQFQPTALQVMFNGWASSKVKQDAEVHNLAASQLRASTPGPKAQPESSYRMSQHG
jgi:hypothetical protein